MKLKITKYVQSCLLVETDDRVALFDPGVMSTSSLEAVSFDRLDNIFITHNHPDHFDPGYLKSLVDKFADVRITSTEQTVSQLRAAQIEASTAPPPGVGLFAAPHEGFAPMMPEPPECIGIDYLGVLSHPGDSHSFDQTSPVLALPVQAPWGSTMRAVQLAVDLKPRHILPIHDWHWSDEARNLMYDRMHDLFAGNGIAFYKLETGQPIEIEL